MKKNIIYLCASFLFLLAGSCTDGFEELNTDPKNPTETSVYTLFNGIIKESLPLGYNEIAAIHNEQYCFQSQQLGNVTPARPLSSGANDIWNIYYSPLKNIHLLKKMLDETQSLKTDKAHACLNILWAYKTLRTVDYVGDMPFSNAGKADLGAEYYKVEYDDQEQIYKECLTMLNDAVKVLMNTSDTDQLTFGNNDTFLKGDFELWTKFANSIILRYALQVQHTNSDFYVPLLTEAMNRPLIEGGESVGVGLWPGNMGNWSVDSRSASFRENNNSCLGTAMWNQMSKNDNVDGSGIIDPRCYVFFEPNIDGEWKAYPQNPDASTPVQDRGAYLTASYPDGRGEGATEQEWSNKGAGCRYSPVNFYLVSDREFIPQMFITVAEVHFLKAELYNRGIGVSQNNSLAKEEYENGIKASLDFWYNQVVEPCERWKINKPSLSQTQIDDYLEFAAYSSDESTALNQIYKQIWIDSFMQPWVGFNLYRRTKLTPRDESGNYSDGDYSFYNVIYPESEKLYNNDNFQNATQGNNTSNKKLFWHK